MGRILFFLFLTAWLYSCSGPKTDKHTDEISYPESTSGFSSQELAQAYCGACHLFPEPGLLTRDIWINKVLPYMGYRLGVRDEKVDPVSDLSSEDRPVIKNAGIFPDQPVISKEDWQKIIEFYRENAPATLSVQEKTDSITQNQDIFDETTIQLSRINPAVVTMVTIDRDNSNMWIGTANNRLEVLNRKFRKIQSIRTQSPPILLKKSDASSAYVLTIGILNPNDQARGALFKLSGASGQFVYSDTLLTGLRRPVYADFGDLNGDGYEDIVICQFGNYLGKLTWFEQTEDGDYQEHILRNQPGSIKSVIHDFNEDGLPDIISLFGQGDEGFFIYYNKGDGHFEEKRILRFSPVYGSNSFELNDFNGDGKMDILYTNGDNADYSFAVKPYHGVRIFIGDENNQFEEKYFYHIPGASGSAARDFDNDGDLDLFIISFFPDYENRPRRSLVFFKNQGGLKFQPQTFGNFNKGRWLVFDTGDIDNDQDQDMAIGSFIYGVTPVPGEMEQEWTVDPVHVLMLKNMSSGSR